jgi:hypothetical protein
MKKGICQGKILIGLKYAQSTAKDLSNTRTGIGLFWMYF